MGVKFVDIDLLYAPYARQDRVAHAGEALGLKVFCDQINAHFDDITILDPHSDVVTALLRNPRVIDQAVAIWHATCGALSRLPVLVCPDSGARKKIHQVAKMINTTGIVYCDKRRDTKTGALSGFTFYAVGVDIASSDLLIVDDLIDGGGTFIAIAEMLRPHTTGRISLAASFGIFSKGLDVFSGKLDHIYVAEAANPNITHPLLTNTRSFS